MKRRTRLRKQGLPPDLPRKPRAALPSLFDLAVQLTQALSVQTALSAQQVHGLASDLTVLEDARSYGVQQVVNCLTTTGMTPSELRWRYGWGFK